MRVAIDDLRAMSATFDLHLDTNSQFLLRQLELNQISSRGRRYTCFDILTATRLFLVSRPCYKACQNTLSLSHPDTLKSYLGGFGSVDTYNDSKDIIQTNFKALSGKFEVYWFLLIHLMF